MKSLVLKSLYVAVLCSILLYLSSCEGSDGCYGNDDYEEDGANYGYLPFNDSTDYWFPDSSQKILSYGNNKGFSSDFVLKSDTSSEKYVVAKYFYPATECRSEEVTDYVHLQQVKLSYTPLKDIFKIVISRKKLVNTEILNKDTVSLQNHGDQIRIEIGNSYCVFITGVPAYSGFNYTYFESITVDAQTLTNVYRIMGAKTFGSGLAVTEVYYKPGAGLLAFIFSNGEIWTKK